MFANVKTVAMARVIAALANAAWPADLYVAQKDPAANDKIQARRLGR